MQTPTSHATPSRLPPATRDFNLGFVLFVASVASIGGFLFGYDTAVINGANTFLQHHFGLDPVKDTWLTGMLTASAILGCIPGAMVSGFLSDRFGRRKILFASALLFAVSAVLSAFPPNIWFFLGARVLCGLGIGMASMACPVYIAEIAPPSWRGRLGTLFQMGIVIGIFVTLFVNSYISGLGDTVWNTGWGWRWMLLAATVPAGLFVVLLFTIPESPRWLLTAERRDAAREVLLRIGSPAYADAEIAAVREVLGGEQGGLSELFGKKYVVPLLIALVLMVGSQFSGINVIMYYSTSIFLKAAGIGQASERVEDFRGGLRDAGAAAAEPEAARERLAAADSAFRSPGLVEVFDKAGATVAIGAALDAARQAPTAAELAAGAAEVSKLADENGSLKAELDGIESRARAKAFSCTVWIGLVNVLATVVAICLVDRLGRKPLLLIGNAIQVLALAAVGTLYYMNSQSAELLLAAVILYVAAFAMAMGPIPWIVCSEIFPARLRGRAMSVATFFIWLACYAVSLSFPTMHARFGSAASFWFFAGCSLLTFVLVLLLLPETKGRTLEEIERSWAAK